MANVKPGKRPDRKLSNIFEFQFKRPKSDNKNPTRKVNANGSKSDQAANKLVAGEQTDQLTEEWPLTGHWILTSHLNMVISRKSQMTKTQNHLWYFAFVFNMNTLIVVEFIVRLYLYTDNYYR